MAAPEKLSFNHIQRALGILLSSPGNPFPNLANHVRINTEEWQGIGFRIKPVRGAHTGKTAKRISEFFQRELQILGNITYRDRTLFGLKDNKNGEIEIEFRDPEKITDALYRHPHPALQEIFNSVRTERLKQEHEKALQQKKQQRLEDENRQRNTKQIAYRKRRKGSPLIEGRSLIPSALCIVHATNFMPRILDDGTGEIDTTTTATQGAIFRNTIHVALNHKVAGHMQGNWEQMPYTIIGDFNTVIERNGVPDNLNSIDTYWIRGHDEALAIPNALIVMPGKPITGLHHITMQQAIYKAKDFTLAETLEILGTSNYYEYIIDAILFDLAAFRHDEEHRQFHHKFQMLANQHPNMELKSALKSFFDFNDIVVKAIEQIYIGINNRRTIEAAIDYLGYDFYPGGGHAMDGSFTTSASTEKLAQRLGTVFDTHAYSAQSHFEKSVNWALAQHRISGIKDMGVLKSLLADPAIDSRSIEVALKVLGKHGIYTPGSNSEPWNTAPLRRQITTICRQERTL